jgi:hypothetical protein
MPINKEKGRFANFLQLEANMASNIQFFVTQPMANLLSLVERHEMRARALSWLTTEGLLEASIGREKLADLVNEELATKNQQVLRMPSRFIPSGHAANESVDLSEVRAGETFGRYGRDSRKINGGPVSPHDLFSSEAWQRRPELKELKIKGKSILEYYEENLEPKTMSIEDRPGKYVAYNLDKMRNLLKLHGVRPFSYGGFDGYIQFMEKGDWMEDAEKRQFLDPNQQHGVNLRPKLKVNRETGEETMADSAYDLNEKGQPVIEFAGGVSSRDDERSNDTVEDMRHTFNQIAHQLQNNQSTFLQDRDEQEIKDLLLTKKTLERVEQALSDKGSGKDSRGRKVGFPETKHGPVSIPVPQNVDPHLLFRAVHLGLNQEVAKPDADKYPNKEVFNQDGGYYKIEGKKLIYKLPKFVQRKIFRKIFEDYKNGVLNVRLRLKDFLPEVGANDAKIVLTKVFNDGVKAQPELVRDAKMYVYKLNGMNPEEYTREQLLEDRPVKTVKTPYGLLPIKTIQRLKT